MKRDHLLLSLLFFISIIAANCSKGPMGPQGATGPQGTTGATGATGPQGPKGDSGAVGPKGDSGVNGTNGTNGVDGTNGTNGADGAQGPAGSANVIYSNWFNDDNGMDITWADSTLDPAVATETFSRAIKYAPDVTTGILDSGVVLCYLRGASLIAPTLLPYTQDGLEINFAPLPGEIMFYIRNPTTHMFNTLGPLGFEYRYIIIPGGVMANGRRLNPRSMNYQQLCTTYHIPQ